MRKRTLVSEHPIVRVHPETGERALYVSPSFLKSIVGLSARESQVVLEFLWEHVVRPSSPCASAGRRAASRSGTTAPRRTSRRGTSSIRSSTASSTGSRSSETCRSGWTAGFDCARRRTDRRCVAGARQRESAAPLAARYLSSFLSALQAYAGGGANA
jgi:hypothetical protein